MKNLCDKCDRLVDFVHLNTNKTMKICSDCGKESILRIAASMTPEERKHLIERLERASME